MFKNLRKSIKFRRSRKNVKNGGGGGVSKMNLDLSNGIVNGVSVDSIEVDIDGVSYHYERPKRKNNSLDYKKKTKKRYPLKSESI